MIAGRGSYYVVCGGFRIFLENHRSRIYSFDTARNLEFKLKAAQTKPTSYTPQTLCFRTKSSRMQLSISSMCKLQNGQQQQKEHLVLWKFMWYRLISRPLSSSSKALQHIRPVGSKRRKICKPSCSQLCRDTALEYINGRLRSTRLCQLLSTDCHQRHHPD